MSHYFRPDTDDIMFNTSMWGDLRCVDTDILSACFHLANIIAAKMVWTYTEPTDGGLDDRDDWLAKEARTTLEKWKIIRPDVLKYFIKRNGKLYLDREWFEIATPGTLRPSLPPSLRVKVGERDNWTCGYCGSLNPPFDIDHVIPISRGGHPSDLNNLLLSCTRCNRSKGAQLAEEWIT